MIDERVITSENETYIEVCAQCTEHNGRLLLVGEKEHLGLAWVVILKHVVVGGSDFKHAVANVLVRHLLEDVSVHLFVATQVVLVGHWERWVHAVRWVLSDALLRADIAPLITVDCADTEHFLLLNAKLLKLASVHLRVFLYE